MEGIKHWWINTFQDFSFLFLSTLIVSSYLLLWVRIVYFGPALIWRYTPLTSRFAWSANLFLDSDTEIGKKEFSLLLRGISYHLILLYVLPSLWNEMVASAMSYITTWCWLCLIYSTLIFHQKAKIITERRDDICRTYNLSLQESHINVST